MRKILVLGAAILAASTATPALACMLTGNPQVDAWCQNAERQNEYYQQQVQQQQTWQQQQQLLDIERQRLQLEQQRQWQKGW